MVNTPINAFSSTEGNILIPLKIDYREIKTFYSSFNTLIRYIIIHINILYFKINGATKISISFVI